MRVIATVAFLVLGCTEPLPDIESEQAPSELLHDHTPHHGGVVGMVEDRHVEVLALADGTIRVYLTDRWRKPLPLDTVRGTVTLGTTVLTLARTTGALEARARAPKPARATLDARVDLEVDDAPLTIEFVLPIGMRSGGAVGVPLAGCIAPATRASDRGASERAHLRSPRCVLDFASEVSALAISPDGARLLLSAVDVGTSAWTLPAVTLEIGWDAPPPLAMLEPEAPHRESANALLASPDSSEAVLALEARLLVYSLADGKVLRQVGTERGIVRNVAWSSDGALLLVSRFRERAGTLLRAADGALVRTLPLPDQAAAVAFDGDGKRAAVGTRGGEITIFETATGRTLGALRGGTRTIEALAFTSAPDAEDREQLVSAGADGVLRIWSVESGEEVARHDLGDALHRIAVARSRRVFATGDRMGRVRLHAHDGSVIETLADPSDGVSVLDVAFGETIVAASDSSGIVAVWDVGSR